MRLADGVVRAVHESLEEFWFACDLFDTSESADAQPEWLFTDNETNSERHKNLPSESDFFKDAFHDYVIHQQHEISASQAAGTEVRRVHKRSIPAQVRSKRDSDAIDSFTPSRSFNHDCGGEAKRFGQEAFGESFDMTFGKRIAEADEFYETRIPDSLSDDRRQIMRQAYAGLLWTKQFYHYVVPTWVDGDPDVGRRFPIHACRDATAIGLTCSIAT